MNQLIGYLNNKALFFSQRNLLTNVYGFGRAVLAFGTLMTFLFNGTNILFSSMPGHYDMLSQTMFSKIGIFYLLHAHLEVARIITIAVLVLVISGWRPRVTGIFHWYFTYSFYLACDYFDGGDQIAAIICLFLIPFCLCDSRKWVWQQNAFTIKPSELAKVRNIFLNVLYFVIRLQVCIIYFHAGVAKMKVNEWIDGTAIYYWFTNHSFGAANWFKPVVVYLFSKSYVVVPITWGTMIFEVILGMSIMMTRNNWNWKILLSLGILFHLGIVIFHGLISFFFSMTACLVLYLYPMDQTIPFDSFFSVLKLKLKLKFT